MVGAMLEELPEGARYTALMSAPENREGLPEPEYDPKAEEYYDRRYWTSDRQHLAQIQNAINQLIVVAGGEGKWKKGKEPDFPIIGPLAWQPEEQKEKARKAKEPKKPATVLDAMRAWGYTGGLADS